MRRRAHAGARDHVFSERSDARRSERWVAEARWHRVARSGRLRHGRSRREARVRQNRTRIVEALDRAGRDRSAVVAGHRVVARHGVIAVMHRGGRIGRHGVGRFCDDNRSRYHRRQSDGQRHKSSHDRANNGHISGAPNKKRNPTIRHLSSTNIKTALRFRQRL